MKETSEETTALMAPPPALNAVTEIGALPEAIPPSCMMKNNNNQRKRKIRDDFDIRDSTYFKIRALVRDLRPRFIEVLRTPDIQKCKAATEIQKGMKLLMDYYRQMPIEGNKRGKHEKSASQVALAGQCQGKEQLIRPLQGGLEENHQPTYVPKETAEKNLSPPPVGLQKKLEGGRLQGSYILGNSVSGWNFITFTNRIPPVYYGVTKESYRHLADCVTNRLQSTNQK